MPRFLPFFHKRGALGRATQPVPGDKPDLVLPARAMNHSNLGDPLVSEGHGGGTGAEI